MYIYVYLYLRIRIQGALYGLLYGKIVHRSVNMNLQVPSIVLHVWLSPANLHCSDNRMCWDHYYLVLLSSTCPGKNVILTLHYNRKMIIALLKPFPFLVDVLRVQDYNWWWGSFLTGGSMAFYFVGYCVYYFVSKLTLAGFTNTFIYFGYTFIMAYVLFLVTGMRKHCTLKRTLTIISNSTVCARYYKPIWISSYN